MGVAIHPADLASLVFRVDVVWIRRILEHPESIAVEHVFPTMIGDTTRVLRIAHPRAVVLQPAIHLVRVLLVETNVIKLRYRQILSLPRFAAAIVRVPHPAIVCRKYSL